MKKTLDINKLKEQLKDFGLNPQQWKIDKIRYNQGELIHKNKPGFRMKGELSQYRGSVGWKQLSLIIS